MFAALRSYEKRQNRADFSAEFSIIMIAVWDCGHTCAQALEECCKLRQRLRAVAHLPRGALAFNGDISTWNVGTVTSMQSMFLNAKASMILVHSHSMLSHKVLSLEL